MELKYVKSQAYSLSHRNIFILTPTDSLNENVNTLAI